MSSDEIHDDFNKPVFSFLITHIKVGGIGIPLARTNSPTPATSGTVRDRHPALAVEPRTVLDQEFAHGEHQKGSVKGA